MNMDELYEMLKAKIQEMHNAHITEIDMDYNEIASLYQMVCFMKQSKHITNGWE